MTEEKFAIGQKVCVTGRGMDAMTHWHGEVKRITPTTVLVRAKDGERRFRRPSMNSIPYSPYGGSHLSGKCQKA